MSRFIAIDVDAGGLFVCAGTAKGTAVRIDAALPVFDDHPRPLSAVSAPALAAKLKAALAAAGVAPAPVLLSVGRERVVFKDIRHPKTGPTEEPAVVRFQAQRDLAEPPDALHLDYVPLPTPADATDKRATAVFVRKELFAAAKTLCDDAGLKLAGFTPRPYATAAAVRRAVAAGDVPPPENPAAPVGVLSLWDGGGEFVVYQGEHLVFSRSVSAGALQSEPALLGEAKRSLAGFASQYPRERLDAIYLCEGHDGGGSWAARLDQALPVPVHPFDPLAGQPAADAIPPHLRGRFATAAGLLAARAAGPLPINFVTPRQPRAEPNKGRQWVLVSLLLLVMVAGGVGGGLWMLHRDLDGKHAAATTRKKQAEKEIADAQLNVNRLKAIEEFRAREVNCVDLFYDVTEGMPSVDKMRLREFEMKAKPPKAEVKAPAAAPKTGGLAAAKPAASTPVATKAPVVEPVGELTLRFVTNSDAEDYLPLKVSEQLAQESRYFTKPEIKFPASTGKRESVVTADLLPRKPHEFKVVINTPFPKVIKPIEPPPVVPPDDWEELP